MLPNCQGCVGSTASTSPSSMDMTGRNTLLLWNVSYSRKQLAFLNIQNTSKHSSFFPFRALQSCVCVDIIPPTRRQPWNIWFTDVSLGWFWTLSCCSRIKSLRVIQAKMDFANWRVVWSACTTIIFLFCPKYSAHVQISCNLGLCLFPNCAKCVWERASWPWSTTCEGLS